MEKPLALKVISIIMIVLGSLRLLAGLVVMLTLGVAGEKMDLLPVIITENFICALIIIISGIILLMGKKFGRISFIIATILASIAYIVFLKSFNTVSTIMQLILIVLLFVYPTIRQYFSKKN